MQQPTFLAKFSGCSIFQHSKVRTFRGLSPKPCPDRKPSTQGGLSWYPYDHCSVARLPTHRTLSSPNPRQPVQQQDSHNYGAVKCPPSFWIVVSATDIQEAKHVEFGGKVQGKVFALQFRKLQVGSGGFGIWSLPRGPKVVPFGGYLEGFYI